MLKFSSFVGSTLHFVGVGLAWLIIVYLSTKTGTGVLCLEVVHTASFIVFKESMDSAVEATDFFEEESGKL